MRGIESIEKERKRHGHKVRLTWWFQLYLGLSNWVMDDNNNKNLFFVFYTFDTFNESFILKFIVFFKYINVYIEY